MPLVIWYYGDSCGFLVCQVKFNTSVHHNDHIQKIFEYSVRFFESEPSKIGHIFTKYITFLRMPEIEYVANESCSSEFKIR